MLMDFYGPPDERDGDASDGGVSTVNCAGDSTVNQMQMQPSGGEVPSEEASAPPASVDTSLTLTPTPDEEQVDNQNQETCVSREMLGADKHADDTEERPSSLSDNLSPASSSDASPTSSSDASTSSSSSCTSAGSPLSSTQPSSASEVHVEDSSTAASVPSPPGLAEPVGFLRTTLPPSHPRYAYLQTRLDRVKARLEQEAKERAEKAAQDAQLLREIAAMQITLTQDAKKLRGEVEGVQSQIESLENMMLGVGVERGVIAKFRSAVCAALECPRGRFVKGVEGLREKMEMARELTVPGASEITGETGRRTMEGFEALCRVFEEFKSKLLRGEEDASAQPDSGIPAPVPSVLDPTTGRIDIAGLAASMIEAAMQNRATMKGADPCKVPLPDSPRLAPVDLQQVQEEEGAWRVPLPPSPTVTVVDLEDLAGVAPDMGTDLREQEDLNTPLPIPIPLPIPASTAVSSVSAPCPPPPPPLDGVEETEDESVGSSDEGEGEGEATPVPPPCVVPAALRASLARDAQSESAGGFGVSLNDQDTDVSSLDTQDVLSLQEQDILPIEDILSAEGGITLADRVTDSPTQQAATLEGSTVLAPASGCFDVKEKEKSRTRESAAFSRTSLELSGPRDLASVTLLDAGAGAGGTPADEVAASAGA